MIDHGKYNVLGIDINAVDYQAAVANIMDAAHHHRAMAISALAVHGVMTGVQDPEHQYRLNQFQLIVPDGQPVRWALRWLHGVRLPERVYGPTLMLRVCQQAAQEGIPVYLYGSKNEVLEKLVENLKERIPTLTIAGFQPSLFRCTTAQEKQQVVEKIRNSGAQITFVGLGCPRQEVWAYEYHQELSMPVLAVGAAFDFHAGTLKQAPAWMQKRGLEWLFRLVMEPRRLWRRYLFLNPVYLWLLFLQMLGVRKFNASASQPPKQPILYG